MRYLVHHLLEISARNAPDAVAVADGERTITYGELDRRANQLAAALRELGVRPGDRTAIYLDKSIEAVIAMYGTMKAGAAYVPLDPQAPVGRLAFIAADAGARALISAPAKREDWDAFGPDRPVLDASDLSRFADESPGLPVIDADLAYVLYTSGSTGDPKGVMLSHRNCLAFVEWAAEEFALTPDDRVSNHAPLHFDLSTFDLFAAALVGAAVVLVPPAVSVFPPQVRAFIENARITVWYSVPSILTMLVLRGGLQADAFPALRTILFAGEVFPTRHLRRLMELLPHVRLANLYGPTETNVCTWWEVQALSPDDDDPIPIGGPIANVDVFAVTDEGRRAQPGEVGELYVRGPTVMQGYLGDPDQTALRLVSNPVAETLEQSVYRTGDLVSPRGDGTYHFLGRRDEQIKSRGYRIELGDIETALHAHPAVSECAVVAIPDELISNRLEAYVCARGEVSVADLQRFCRERIPAYMIPEAITFTDALPRTSTGKVDRRGLAERGSAQLA